MGVSASRTKKRGREYKTAFLAVFMVYCREKVCDGFLEKLRRELFGDFSSEVFLATIPLSIS